MFVAFVTRGSKWLAGYFLNYINKSSGKKANFDTGGATKMMAQNELWHCQQAALHT